MVIIKRLIVAYTLVALIAFTVLGCSLTPAATTAEPLATVAVLPPHVASTSTLTVSPEIQARVTTQVTPIDPDTLDEASRSQLGSQYYLVVASVTEDESAILPPNQKRMVLTVNAGSESSSIRISPESIALVGIAGDVYSPVPEYGLTPYLLGAKVEPNTTFYGFVAIDTPAAFKSGMLVWCLEDDYPCDKPLLATLP